MSSSQITLNNNSISNNNSSNNKNSSSKNQQMMQLQQFSSAQNPYNLLRKMNKVITDQKLQIDQYELAMESMQKQKEILINQKKKLETLTLSLLTRIDNSKSKKNTENSLNKSSKVSIVNVNFFKNKPSSPTCKKISSSSIHSFPFSQEHANLKPNSLVALNINIIKKIQETLHTNPHSQTPYSQQYIPEPIKLNTKTKQQQQTYISLHNLTMQNFSKNDYIYGDNMLENFMIIGPDIQQLKKKRQSHSSSQKPSQPSQPQTCQSHPPQLQVKSSCLYSSSKFYKQHKKQFLTEISKRAFPEGCLLKRKLIQHNEQLLDLIQYKVMNGLSDDCFIFTIKGDESLCNGILEKGKNGGKGNNAKRNVLYTTNENCFLFVVCLKVPDFVYIRDEKNYYRNQNQIWVGEKVYAIASYFPFFHIHTDILCKIHETISKNIVKKILIDNQMPLTWNIAKSVYQVQKNEETAQIIKYFSNKKPEYNHVCYHASNYFGTFPQFGYKSLYAISLYTCPVFFSNFSYQQMLLLLTAILCQKTLIFLSSVEAKATLSALFLINLISPFQYSYPLLLNCDSDKVKSMIFQFPFAMICSIKKTQNNLEQILQLFAESNTMRSVQNDAQYIVIDVDSNSILYHHVLSKLFSQCIVQPNKQIRQAYLSVNPCESKSFSLPKVLPRENFKPNTKPKSQLQKRKQEIKKSVKQYQQKILTNQTKIPLYRRNQKHEYLLKLLTDYVQEFTFNANEEKDYEILNKLESVNKNNRIQIVKNHLLERDKNRGELLARFLESQMYANYLDSILKNS